MKYLKWGLIIIISIMGCSKNSSDPVIFYKNLNVLPIQAHRGGGFALPENTLETFTDTWNNKMIPEGDIRTSSDDVIVCMHDDTVGRVAPNAPIKLKKVNIEEIDLKNIKTLDVGEYRGKPGEKIPTLEEVFIAMKGKPERLMYLDYKHIDMERLARLVKKYGLERQIIFTTKNYDLILKWKKLIPESLTMIWIGGSLKNIETTYNMLKSKYFDGLTTLQIHVKLDNDGALIPDQEFLDACKHELDKHGVLFQVLPWRIKDPKVYKRLMDIGIRSFATDFPKLTASVYQEYLKR